MHSTRKSLRWAVTLAVVMIVLLVALIVGWVLLSGREALAGTRLSPLYWTVLSVGTAFLVLILVGVVLYMILWIKAINLTDRQSNFIDAVTHELKSPIASLKLYLQTLGRRHVSEQQRADFVRFMLDDVERLDQLINQMLEAAQLEKKPADAELVDVDLSAVLANCRDLVCLRYRVPPGIVHTSLEPALVRARPLDVELVFRNLLDNAIKYAGTPPEVWLSAQLDPNDRVTVRIADNGRGIPPQWRWKIFRRFVRLGSELEREKPGTGLGLYIVDTLVRRLKGRIAVRDRPHGPGTLFEVQLPARAAPAAHRPPASGALVAS